MSRQKFNETTCIRNIVLKQNYNHLTMFVFMCLMTLLCVYWLEVCLFHGMCCYLFLLGLFGTVSYSCLSIVALLAFCRSKHDTHSEMAPIHLLASPWTPICGHLVKIGCCIFKCSHLFCYCFAVHHFKYAVLVETMSNRHMITIWPCVVMSSHMRFVIIR